MPPDSPTRSVTGMNRVILIGHLGQDPELRSRADGTPTTTLSIATNNARKVDGQWVETTDWHRVQADGRNATYLVEHAKKGDLLAVDCTLRPRKWEDTEGKTHHDVIVLVERIAALHHRVGGKAPEAPALAVSNPNSESPF